MAVLGIIYCNSNRKFEAGASTTRDLLTTFSPREPPGNASRIPHCGPCVPSLHLASEGGDAASFPPPPEVAPTGVANDERISKEGDASSFSLPPEVTGSRMQVRIPSVEDHLVNNYGNASRFPHSDPCSLSLYVVSEEGDAAPFSPPGSSLHRSS